MHEPSSRRTKVYINVPLVEVHHEVVLRYLGCGAYEYSSAEF